MPRKTRQLELLPETSPTAIPAELLDHVVKGPMTQQSLEVVMKNFRKAVIERALNAEMSHHLGYAPVKTSRPILPIIAMGRAARPC